MQALLSFDQAPPYSVPVRFMATAPLFGIAAGVLLLVAGGDVLDSRWSPATLALTHLFTAGFLLQVMLGALLQIMPVAVGANVWHPLWLARVVHPASAVGAACLVAGLLAQHPGLLHAAAAALGLAVAAFVGAAGMAMWQVPNSNLSGAALKLALSGLTVTVALGLALVAALTLGYPWPLRVLTDLHAGWGLLAWCGSLLVGVAYVVVPMFQLTPGYSAAFSRRFAPLLILALLLWTPLRIGEFPLPAGILQVVLAGFAIVFAATTLSLQRRSKRSRADTTMLYWRTGMVATILAAAAMALATLIDDDAAWPRLPLLIGVLAIGGALVSVISGLLYKILPFLSWQHLQNAAGLRGKVPHMGDYLPERLMKRQWFAHLAALLLLLLAVWQPQWLARPAGAALIIAQTLLLTNVLRVVRRYREVRAGLVG